MKSGKLTFLLLYVLILLTGCIKDDEIIISCELPTFISEDLYLNSPSDELTINELAISDNCLNINFNAGGCQGETWELKLIASEAIFESDPPQKNIRLSLNNEEPCEALITKELSFDISVLQLSGSAVILNFTNSDDEILYEY